MTARELAAYLDTSYVTATRVLTALKNDFYVFLLGNRHYICKGVYAKNSDLFRLINKSDEKLVGMHIRDLTVPFFSGLAKELQTTLSNAGYRLTILTSSNDASKEREILEYFIRLKCSAVLSFAGLDDNAVFECYNRYPLPYVLLGRTLHGLEAEYVISDNFAAGVQAAQHLIACGYKEFSYIGHLNLSEKNDSRLEGFKRCLYENGFLLKDELNIKIDLESDEKLPFFMNKLKKHSQNAALGIFCYDDLFAVKILNRCYALGLNVPNRVGIIGYDDLPISSAVSPAITTFFYSYTAFADKVSKILSERINNPAPSSQKHKIQTVMTVRASTKLNTIPIIDK